MRWSSDFLVVTAMRAVTMFVVAGTVLSAVPVYAKIGDKAGVAGAVRGKVSQATYSSAKKKIGRKVASGDPIFLGDRITTGNQSGLQIMLLDRTTFTIGPDAEMMIDKFVYNPSSKSGSMSARIVKGTFRFVSGAIERNNPEGVTIKTPVATIGVRGTTVIGHTNGRNLLAILAGPGRHNNVGRPASRIIITAGGRRVVIFRSGFGTFVSGLGAKPSTPRRYGLKVLSRLLKQLIARPGSQDANSLNLIAPGAGPGSGTNFFAGNFTGQWTQQGSDAANQQSSNNAFWITLYDTSNQPQNNQQNDNTTNQPGDTTTPPPTDHHRRRHWRHRFRGFGLFHWRRHHRGRRLEFIFLRIGRDGQGHARRLLLIVKRVLTRDRHGRPVRLLVVYRPLSLRRGHFRSGFIDIRRIRDRHLAFVVLRALRFRGGDGRWRGEFVGRGRFGEGRHRDLIFLHAARRHDRDRGRRFSHHNRGERQRRLLLTVWRVLSRDRDRHGLRLLVSFRVHGRREHRRFGIVRIQRRLNRHSALLSFRAFSFRRDYARLLREIVGPHRSRHRVRFLARFLRRGYRLRQNDFQFRRHFRGHAARRRAHRRQLGALFRLRRHHDDRSRQRLLRRRHHGWRRHRGDFHLRNRVGQSTLPRSH